MDWELFVGATIMSLVFVLVGMIWKVYPPKKINHLYGYRTQRSMANQQIWDYSNKIGALMFLYLGAALLGLSLLAYIIFPNESPIIAMILMFFGIGLGIYWCESRLTKKFNKKGKPRSTS